MILEIGKSYIKKYYDGNVEQAVANKDGILYTDKGDYIRKNGEVVKNAGDFNKYMKNNKQYALFIKI